MIEIKQIRLSLAHPRVVQPHRYAQEKAQCTF
jgi:hypothetical protein